MRLARVVGVVTERLHDPNVADLLERPREVTAPVVVPAGENVVAMIEWRPRLRA